MWESCRCWRDFQGAAGRVENLGLVFQAFHGTAISTALLAPVLCFCAGLVIRFHLGFPLADFSWRVPRDNW